MTVLGRWTATFLLAVAVIFVVAEVVLRTVYSNDLREQAYPLVYQPDELIGYRYVPDSTGSICNVDVCKAFAIGSNGFTGPIHPARRTPGIYRIAVVGSSNETGIWLNSGDNYLEQMDKRFAAAGIRAEVVNVSIDGAYRDVEKVILAGADALGFAPDIVALDVELPFRYTGSGRSGYRGYMISYNSGNPTSLEAARAYIDWLLGHKILTTLYDSSFIVRALARYYSHDARRPYVNAVRTYITKRFETPDMILRPISLERSLETLKDLQAHLRITGAKLLLFRYVDDPEWIKSVTSAGLPYVVLGVEQNAGTTYQDSHYSEAGHKMLAQQLFEKLASLDLPPAEYRPTSASAAKPQPQP